ncbi:hypothetical protein GobsT_50340 [Gemmata obscuriglobus]|uniref:DUF551 domain-containing protein n=1 Tax=Gemmata obscuriglobus TaxID=114 RepID=A0A2Z3GZY6_9BACT|nr:phage protein [Gemmata obscuriglobus]AWM37057.1 hypothetical protein C1280_08500 [Gemmata obscuriglobus]QEG30231.1 hypothetical protein GobsT_50340 [Gemmata obscuriglobus]VTS09555.1 unnamed protein product [Gemmata obscuriglobus UQM 2246]
MKAAFEDTVRMVADALDSILAFEEVCDRGSDSGGWQSEELEAAFKKVVAARASLPALTQQWLPIESAPRDGTEILLFVPSLLQCPVVTGSVNKHGTVWIIYDDGMDGHGSATTQSATHWMPLPAARKQEGTE